MSDKKPKLAGAGGIAGKLFGLMEHINAIFLAMMIFFTFMNVVLRQFKMGFTWSEEVARISFIYLVYLGSIIAARENAHLMVDTLFTHLHGMAQKILYAVIQILIIGMMAFLGIGAWQNAWRNRADFWVATHFPVFLVHFAGVIMAASITVLSLANLYRMIVKKEDPAVLFSTAADAEEEGGKEDQ